MTGKKLLIFCAVAGTLLYGVSAGVRGDIGLLLNPVAASSGQSYEGVSIAIALMQLAFGATRRSSAFCSFVTRLARSRVRGSAVSASRRRAATRSSGAWTSPSACSPRLRVCGSVERWQACGVWHILIKAWHKKIFSWRAFFAIIRSSTGKTASDSERNGARRAPAVRRGDNRGRCPYARYEPPYPPASPAG